MRIFSLPPHPTPPETLNFAFPAGCAKFREKHSRQGDK